MEQVTANLSGGARRAKLQGREYIIAPLTLIVPGVLNGSKGPLYYSPEEVSKNPGVWNGVPIVVNHPSYRGQHVSARDPEVLNEQWVGYVFRSQAKEKLVAEGWFDIGALERVDNRIFQALERGDKIELSTGLFTDNEPAPSGAVTNDGVPYSFIARNYRPDHLAILLDQIGACSVIDGCGVNVNAEDLSHDDLNSLLSSKLKEKLGGGPDSDIWIQDTFDDSFVYQQEGKLYRLGYGRSKDEVMLSEEQPIEVKRVTTFEPITNTDRKEPDMAQLSDEARKKIVDDLIANTCCWDEPDREVLNGLDDGKLGQFKAQAEKDRQREVVLNTAKKGFEDQQGNSHTFNEKESKWESKIKEPEPEPVVNKEEPITEAEWLAKTNAPPSVREKLEFAHNEESKQKSELIDRLTVNISDEARPEQRKRLETRSLEDLRNDLALLPEKQREVASVANYAGAAAPSGAASRGEKDFAPFGLPDEYIEAEPAKT